MDLQEQERQIESLREQESERKKRPTFKDEMISWLKTLCITFLLVFVIQRFIFISVSVEGRSMEPTFFQNDRLILWILGSNLSNFDVVVLEQPTGRMDIKRVVGLPGDRVDYIDGILYLNEQAVDEPHLDPNMESRRGFLMEDLCQFPNCDVIPDEYVLVLGDNRNNSRDSRDTGLVHMSQIQGRVIWRFWPLGSFGGIE